MNDIVKFEKKIKKIQEMVFDLRNTTIENYSMEFHSKLVQEYSNFFETLYESKIDANLKLIYVDRVREMFE
ncbi:hypothetical protein [Liquorilactobacillus hordei]|nr:hypothetical protein [Liquorilactobacillus hordei]QYH51025.1 hypothetical protein G6O70_00220 [Liquorilactobacillus hordei DSM 19519]